MPEALKPHNEEKRLATLKSLNVLDTPIEERYERITRIVCQVLDVPISAISLIDKDRQWFKSIQGLNTSETARSLSFCAHAILGDEPLIVPNALEDSRFAQNDLVTGDPKIRFYVGIPIEIGDGVRLGALCAIDNKPRQISQADLEILKDLAAMIKAELSSVKLSHENLSFIKDMTEAERVRNTDSETRLWNKSGAEALLKREVRGAIDNNESLSVAIFDVTHSPADLMLRSFSDLVLSMIRPYDSLCRWDEKKFLLILPDCGSEVLKDVLEDILLVTNHMAINAGGTTMSSGVKTEWENLVEKAQSGVTTSQNKGVGHFTIVP